MDNVVSHLDITTLFCAVDDFCQSFDKHAAGQIMLPSMAGEKKSRSRMSQSEVMTIVIAFHGSGFRTFKDFYNLMVRPFWRKAFPNLVSYNRFVELMPWTLMLLCCFLQTRMGDAVVLFLANPHG